MADRGRRKVDDQLLAALACGATAEAAARSAGVSASTVQRRLRSDVVERSAAALSASGTEAVKTLLALMKDTCPPAVRLGAAKAVLELGVRLREAAELEQRLAALEAQLLGQG